MSLLLAIFLLNFVTKLIAWIGQQVILDSVYALYLTVTRSSLASKQRTLKTEILNKKSELLRTSAQDEFAKWAKLRRSVDKGLADLEKLNSEISSTKSSFSMKFKTALWVVTNGVQFFVTWWYRKQPVFYLPEGWLGPLTWWLALPFAPKGSVSVPMWSYACTRVISVLERFVKSYFEAQAAAASAPDSKSTPRKAKAVPVPSSRKATVESEDEKSS